MLLKLVFLLYEERPVIERHQQLQTSPFPLKHQNGNYLFIAALM